MQNISLETKLMYGMQCHTYQSDDRGPAWTDWLLVALWASAWESPTGAEDECTSAIGQIG